MRRGEAYERVGQLPHCDGAVLHAPGECEYCDRHPDWQALRLVWGIAFTGHEPAAISDDGHLRELPCPADYARGQGQAHTWGGNRPTRVDAPEQETLASQIMYGHVGPGQTGQPRPFMEEYGRPDLHPEPPKRPWWFRWLGGA